MHWTISGPRIENLKVVHAVDTVGELGLEHLVEAAGACCDEAEEWGLLLVSGWTRDGIGAALTLGLSTLDWYSAWNCVPWETRSVRRAAERHEAATLTDKVRVVLDLEDLHTLTRLVPSNEVQTGGLQPSNVLWVDLVSVTVSLLDLFNASVQSTDLGPLGTALEDGLSGTETHGTAHVLLVELRHGDDHTVAGRGFELLGVGTRHATDVSCELDGGGLEAEADLNLISKIYGRMASRGLRLTPRNGTWFSLANFVASIIPSVPREPNPPGTMTPDAFRISCHAWLYFSGSADLACGSRCSASTQTRLSFRRRCIEECSRDLTTDK